MTTHARFDRTVERFQRKFGMDPSFVVLRFSDHMRLSFEALDDDSGMMVNRYRGIGVLIKVKLPTMLAPQDAGEVYLC